MTKLQSKSRQHGGSVANIIIFDTETSEEQKEAPKERPALVQEQMFAKNVIPNSTISSILVKPILEYCIPIISELPRVVITPSDIEKYSNIKTKVTTARPSISLVLDRDTVCILNNKRVMATAGQLINIMGLDIPDKITSIFRLSVYDYLATDHKYKIHELLRSGLYGLYNSYNNYYSSYIAAQKYLTHARKIIFTKDTNANNSQIIAFFNCVTRLNQIYASVQPLALTVEANILANSKLHSAEQSANINKPDRATLFDWLIANKLANTEHLKYFNANVETIKLIEKIQWYDSPKDAACAHYVDRLKQLLEANIRNNTNKASQTIAEIDLARKKNIAYSKFGTSDINALNAAQQKAIMQEFLSKKFIDKTYEIMPVVRELTTAIQLGENSEIQRCLKDLYKAMGKEDKVKLDKQRENDELQFSRQIKLAGASKAEVDKKTAAIVQINEVCPHLVEQAERLIMGSSPNTIANVIATKYGAQESTTRATREQRDTYCKLCGALLAEYDEEDIAYKERDNYIMTAEDDEIFSMVKRELQYVIGQYTITPPDSPFGKIERIGIIDLLSSIIRTKILEIQGDLIKIKTLADNDMWVLLNVYIYIYIFAILTQFVFINPNILQFRNIMRPDYVAKKHVLNGTSATTAVDETSATTAVDGTSATTTISHPKVGARSVQLTKSSKDILANLLKQKQGKESLERLTTHALAIIKQIKSSEISTSKYITTSNIKELFLMAYKWTMTLNYNIESLDELIGKQDSKLPQTDIDQYNLVMFFEKNGTLGRDTKKIEDEFAKSVPIYSTAQIKKDSPPSLKTFYNYVVGERYQIKPVPHSPELASIINQFAQERVEETISYRSTKIDKLRPYIIPPTYDIRENKLDLPFELVGSCSKRCTRTYVYKDKSKYVEFTKDQIVEWLTTKNDAKLKSLYDMKCIGMKCVCSSKAKKSEAFFKYFEQFCPKGELHEYVDKKCKKCGITDDIINTRDDSYYAKYSDAYVKIRKRENELINHEVMKQIEAESARIQRVSMTNKTKTPQDKQKSRPSSAETIKTFPELKYSTEHITELAKLVPIKNFVNLFLSIGMYEGISYKALESNKMQPFLNAEPDAYKAQTLATHNFILYMYRQYYTAKSSEYLIKLPPDLKTILSKSSQNNKDFGKKLTDLDMHYIEMYDYYAAQKVEPKLLANFCLASLAKLFIDADNIFKKAKLNTFGRTWIQFYLAKIIAYERYLCAVSLKNLKPLARYQDDEAAEDSRFEDNDMVQANANAEESVDEAVVEQYDETGNEYANDDVDIEREDDEDNMDNTFITVD